MWVGALPFDDEDAVYDVIDPIYHEYISKVFVANDIPKPYAIVTFSKVHWASGAIGSIKRREFDEFELDEVDPFEEEATTNKRKRPVAPWPPCPRSKFYHFRSPKSEVWIEARPLKTKMWSTMSSIQFSTNTSRKYSSKMTLLNRTQW